MLYGDMTTLRSVTALTDSELLAQVTAFAGRERHSTADLIAGLAELDMRRLYLAAGYSSLLRTARVSCTCRNTRRMGGSKQRAPSGAFPSSLEGWRAAISHSPLSASSRRC